MRGEHKVSVNFCRKIFGSSPHARGTQREFFISHTPARFIPACAGNTHNTLPLDLSQTVHPRMRGEHFSEHHRKAA